MIDPKPHPSRLLHRAAVVARWALAGLLALLLPLGAWAARVARFETLLGDKGITPLTAPYLRPQPSPDNDLQTLRRQQSALDWLLNGLITGEQFHARVTQTDETHWCFALERFADGSLSVEGLPVQWQARPISVPWARVTL